MTVDYITANYHTHTIRCNHAVGEDKEYVEAAIEAGIQTLGFSDHIPWGDAIPYEHARTVRMHRSQIEDYVTSIRGLQKEYASDIRILLGFEAEYLPMFYEEQMQWAKDYALDFQLLGQHFVQMEGGLVYTGAPTSDAAVLEKYVDTVIEAARTGSYLYLAHPDLINYNGDPDIYREQMTRLCREMKACGIPLEINLLGTGTQRHYPGERFFSIAGEAGNDVVFGVDAHDPVRFADQEAYRRGRDLAEKCGVHLVEELL